MKKALKTLLAVLLALVLAAGGYVAYVFLTLYRLDDDLPMEISSAEPGGVKAEAVVPVGQEFTAVSYNIGFGAYSDDFTFFMDGGKESRARSAQAVYQNITGAMNSILPYDPDFALIQEVDIDGTRSWHIDERDLVAPMLTTVNAMDYTFAQNYDSPYLFYPILSPHGANKSGIMTFAKYRINSALRKSLPIEKGFSSVLDLDRCYSKSRFATDNGKELVVYDLHLSAYTSDPQTAETQLSILVQDMQAEYDAGNYCIAGGDFNRDLLGNSPEIFHTAVLDDNWAKPVNMDLFTEDITLVAPFDEAEPVASCRNPDKPYEKGDYVVTVDGFIKSANVEAVESKVIDTGFKYSDHNPVYIKFRLK